jgi:polysaccharide biosynthesis transport protein
VNISRIRDALKKRWWFIVAAVAVGILIGAVATQLMTPEYRSTARLFVTTTGGTSSTESYQGEQFSQQRTGSYAQLLMSEQLAQRVIDKLNLPMSASELASKIRAEIVPRTVLLDVSVSDTSPQRAADIAKALVPEFIAFTGSLETPAGQSEPRSTVTVVSDATTPTSPVSPKLSTNLFYGFFAGLVVGVIAVLLQAFGSRRVRTLGDLARVSGGSALGPVEVPRHDVESGASPLTDAASSAADGFRKLRVQIEAQEPPPAVVLTTGASPKVSAAGFSVALAAAFAEAGRKTVLVCADPDALPFIESLTGVEGGPGLAETLDGQAPVTLVLQPMRERNQLCLISPGKSAGLEPMLSSPAMANLVDELRQSFDRIVIAIPAVGSSSAASVLSAVADSELLLVDAATTHASQVEHAVSELRSARANLRGAVLIES